MPQRCGDLLNRPRVSADVSKEVENTVLSVSEPDEFGHFGPYGGTYVAETLMHALDELKEAYERWRQDEEFMARMDSDLAFYVGRPSPIYFARRLTELAGGARILLKREDLNHTGAHKINNTVAAATPCCPAPVSAITRVLPM